ncbi:sensor histidine kinase [Xanthocytophaga flava]|uniref:sensor histidine kinase n=1 Tax=Xanthocytophaga flava TaxID=3048013 RepID=UPI0028D650B2|nr:histidine kinase [Xanthocytophaga flavus]MDJ1469355.1 histidine kinase [Xanthocytophaga flavus]
MKNLLLFLFFVVCLITPTYAQIPWGEYSQSYNEGIYEDPSKVDLILAIRKENNSFWVTHETSKHFTLLSKDSAFLKDRPLAKVIARTTFDTAQAHFFLHGVTPANAHNYQYRLSEYPGNRILLPWKPISEFTDSVLIKESTLPKMAYLGGYKTQLGKTLIIDVRQENTHHIVATSLISWESIRPQIAEVYTSANFDIFLRKLQYPWMSKATDTSLSLSDKIVLPYKNANLILVLQANIYDKSQIQYEVIRDGSVFTPWQVNGYDNSFVWIKDYPPGMYQIHIRYTAQPEHTTSYQFEVTPVWYQSTWFRVCVGIFSFAFWGAVASLVLYFRQKQRIQQELSNKTKVQLELKAIYAQLNPHFVFNALGSIQGLINKQDVQGANEYLSDFARLLRESLQNSNKDTISLYEEVQMLETYLKLEKLRFGFSYQINVQKEINLYETSIPSLLLQPLVENAVKHGVSSLYAQGIIEIDVSKQDDSMVIMLQDNGKGFVPEQSPTGYGLKLTKERISLLNKLNKEQPIDLSIHANTGTGTSITLTFYQWFL